MSMYLVQVCVCALRPHVHDNSQSSTKDSSPQLKQGHSGPALYLKVEDRPENFPAKLGVGMHRAMSCAPIYIVNMYSEVHTVVYMLQYLLCQHCIL